MYLQDGNSVAECLPAEEELSPLGRMQKRLAYLQKRQIELSIEQDANRSEIAQLQSKILLKQY